MIYLSQRNPAWAEKKLGASKLTIGRYGCTTTCISMLSDYFRAYISPDKIAAHKEFYTKDGLIIWGKLALARMKFDRRAYTVTSAEVLSALKDPNRAVLLEVNNGQHWVVAIKKALFRDDFVIVDPWTGKQTTAKGTYHNITGAAFFKRA